MSQLTYQDVAYHVASERVHRHYEDLPNFRNIVVDYKHFEILHRTGWWERDQYCPVALETLSALGPLVMEAAAVLAHNQGREGSDQKMSGSNRHLHQIAKYLKWFASVYENKHAQSELEQVAEALFEIHKRYGKTVVTII